MERSSRKDKRSRNAARSGHRPVPRGDLVTTREPKAHRHEAAAADAPTMPTEATPDNPAETKTAIDQSVTTTDRKSTLDGAQNGWRRVFASELDVLSAILTARGRRQAYRHHLWMRRAAWLHRLLRRLQTRAAEIERTTNQREEGLLETGVDSNTEDANHREPYRGRRWLQRVCAAAARESLNEVACDRMDTIGTCLCVAACASRFHALLSFMDDVGSPASSRTAAVASRCVFGWAMPRAFSSTLHVPLAEAEAEAAKAAERGLSLRPGRSKRRTARGVAEEPMEGNGGGTVDRSVPADIDESAGPKTLGQFVDSLLEPTRHRGAEH